MVNNAPAKRWLSEADDPALREPVPASQEFPPSSIPIPSTVRETLHASDPASGWEWALRSWRGRPNPKARFGNHHPSHFVCYQVGIRRGGQLFEPRFGGSPRLLEAGQEAGGETGGCNESRLCCRPQSSRGRRELHRSSICLRAEPGTHSRQRDAPAGGQSPDAAGRGRAQAAPYRRQSHIPGDPAGSLLGCAAASLCGRARTHDRTECRSDIAISPRVDGPADACPRSRRWRAVGLCRPCRRVLGVQGRIVDGRLAGISEREGSIRHEGDAVGQRRALFRASPQSGVRLLPPSACC